LQRAGDLHQRAQFAQIAGSALRRLQLIEQAVEIVLLVAERDLVGVLKTELDTVGVAQRPARDALAVYPCPVPALQILDDVIIAVADNARVRPRYAVVTQHQAVVGVPPDRERKPVQRHPRAITGRIDHDQKRGSLIAGFGFPALHRRPALERTG
jgi:hypothetical protein